MSRGFFNLTEFSVKRNFDIKCSENGSRRTKKDHIFDLEFNGAFISELHLTVYTLTVSSMVCHSYKNLFCK